MKGKLFIIILLGIVFVNLQSCSLRHDGSDEPTTGSSVAASELNPKVETDSEMLQSGDRSKFISESQALFNELIQNNPIDQAYNAETTDDTTLGFINHESKYAGIWLEELSYSCECLLITMNEEERETFLKLQDEWITNLDNEMLFVRNFFTSDTQIAKQGSIFWVEREYYYREKIRERTLYIKYLLFLQGSNVVFIYE